MVVNRASKGQMILTALVGLDLELRSVRERC